MYVDPVLGLRLLELAVDDQLRRFRNFASGRVGVASDAGAGLQQTKRQLLKVDWLIRFLKEVLPRELLEESSNLFS